MTGTQPGAGGDPDVVAELARLFREHPAWREAARQIAAPEATSDVYFTHRPGETWHLELHDGAAVLLPGRSASPDFVFRFAPGAVRRLLAVRDGIGGFAVALFEGMTASTPETRVDFRVVAPFTRLVRRGYLRLLLAGGPQVLAFGARHGVHGLRDLRRVVRDATRRRPEAWEESGG